MKRNVVECGDCAYFIKPEIKIHNRVQAGKCKSFEEGKSKTNNQETIKKAYIARGNCEFLYCTKRFCENFKNKNGD